MPIRYQGTFQHAPQQFVTVTCHNLSPYHLLIIALPASRSLQRLPFSKTQTQFTIYLALNDLMLLLIGLTINCTRSLAWHQYIKKLIYFSFSRTNQKVTVRSTEKVIWPHIRIYSKKLILLLLSTFSFTASHYIEPSYSVLSFTKK
jgi:hypothetical protein